MCALGFLGALLRLLGLLDFKLHACEQVGGDVLLQPGCELLRGVIQSPPSGMPLGREGCVPPSFLAAGYCCSQVAPSAATCLRRVVLSKDSVL